MEKLRLSAPCMDCFSESETEIIVNAMIAREARFYETACATIIPAGRGCWASIVNRKYQRNLLSALESDSPTCFTRKPKACIVVTSTPRLHGDRLSFTLAIEGGDGLDSTLGLTSIADELKNSPRRTNRV